MIKKNSAKEPEKTNYISQVWYRFFPYWPLFAILSFIFLIPALFFYFILQPSYSITSAVVISDLNAAANEDPNLKFINIYGSQKVVENEVRVLQSRSLMQQVVEDLALYAPVFEESGFSTESAYTSSPVKIRAKDPESISSTPENIAFEFNEQTSTVSIEGKSFQLDEWYQFPFGEIRFEKNPFQLKPAEEPLSFSIMNPLVTTEAFLNKLQVSSEGKLSTIINILYTDVVPERGVDILSGLLEVYNSSTLEVQNQLAQNTLAFAEERIKDIEAELDSTERRIQEFRAEEGVIDLSAQGKLYLENISDNERRAAEVNVQLAVLEQVENYLNSGNAEIGIVPTSLGIEDPVLTLLLERLNQLELQYAALKTTTGQKNPLVQSTESEIAKIRPNIREIVENQKSRLQAGLRNIRSTSGEFSSQLRDIPEQERELLEISREQSTKREIYTYLLQRREEAAIAAAATLSDIRVFEQPQAGTGPSGSKKMLLLIGAVIAALMATVAFVLYKEFLTTRVLFRSGLEKIISIPVVSEIFYSKKLNPAEDNPLISQQLFQLQLALGLFEESQNKKKILITSSIANEGKTFLLNQLGIKLASSGKKVILLDFDFVSTELSSLYNLNNNQGIKEFLEKKKDMNALIYKSQKNNLDVLPAGSKGLKTELLLTKAVSDLLESLEELYDYILIDTPPVEQASDAYILYKKSDAAIFVVRHDFTPSSALEKLQVSGDLGSFKDAVVVFNGVKGRGFLKKYYGYNLGYGYDSPNAAVEHGK